MTPIKKTPRFSPFWKQFILVMTSVILSGISVSYMTSRTTEKLLIENAASIEYVDKTALEIITYADKQDAALEKESSRLSKAIDEKADKDKMEMIYLIVKKNSETNQKIYEYLLTIKK
ncbi:MAG: hypothetical protein IMZ64_11490 [Bacteroidetes bacterium]|nr:hypothetical protein [Bacteroidota bacterium]